MAILAAHTTRCGICDELIVANEDEITEVDGEWVHAECAENGDDFVVYDSEDA